MVNKTRKPKDLKIEHGAMGVGELHFHIYDYGGNKGLDGRFSFQNKAELTGHFGTKVIIEQDLCIYGMGVDNLRRIAKWAEQAANYIEENGESST